MDKIVDILIEKETLDGDEFLKISQNLLYPAKKERHNC